MFVLLFQIRVKFELSLETNASVPFPRFADCAKSITRKRLTMSGISKHDDRFPLSFPTLDQKQAASRA